MQCVIDAGNITASPLYWRNLELNLLRRGFGKVLVLAGRQGAEIPLLEHTDLHPKSFCVLPVVASLENLLALRPVLEEGFLFLNAANVPDFNWLDLAMRGLRSGVSIHASCVDGGASLFWLRGDDLHALAAGGNSNLWETLRQAPFALWNYAGKIWRPGNWRGMPARGAVFLDRDGVLNQDFGYVHQYANWLWLPGAKQSIKAMNDAGYFVFVVTNQSGIARGYFPESDVHALHSAIQADLADIGAHIDAFAHCPHLPDAPVEAWRKNCACRKPGPELIRRLCESWPIDLSASFIVGDKPRDLAAGAALGLPGFLFSEPPLDLPRYLAELGKFNPPESAA